MLHRNNHRTARGRKPADVQATTEARAPYQRGDQTGRVAEADVEAAGSARLSHMSHTAESPYRYYYLVRRTHGQLQDAIPRPAVQCSYGYVLLFLCTSRAKSKIFCCCSNILLCQDFWWSHREVRLGLQRKHSIELLSGV